MGGSSLLVPGLIMCTFVLAGETWHPEFWMVAAIILFLTFLWAATCDIADILNLDIIRFVAIRYSSREVPEQYKVELKRRMNVDVQGALISWSPFILIFLVLLCTAKVVAPIYNFLAPFKTTVNIYAGNPDATITFTWINTPGVLILICGIVGGIIQGCPFDEMMQVLWATCKQMSKTILTMLAVLGCAKIMGYSGMIASIAAFFVGTLGGLYPLVAPVLGALGTFVTGSGTSSEVLFGSVQQQAAQAIGANEYWLCAANSLGVSAGKMLSPQSIAIGTASYPWSSMNCVRLHSTIGPCTWLIEA